jgi:branched-chain amino acid transport system ATP-binding protein
MEAAILATESLTKDFGGYVAINNVNLSFAPRKTVALIGPNGAGKTTLFNLICGFLTPSRGRVLFMGNDIRQLRPHEVARHGLVRSFQITSVFPHLTVSENLRLALMRNDRMEHKFWRSGRSLQIYDARIQELLDHVSIPANVLDEHAGALPYGMKRSLELATTLAMDPKVMLLDEPTAGMTAGDVERITALIRKVSFGRTVVLIEHNLRVVADLADTIVVLLRGEVLTSGSYDQVRVDSRVVEAYLGTGAANHA